MAKNERTEISEDEFLKSLDALEAVIGNPIDEMEEDEDLTKSVDERDNDEELLKSVDNDEDDDNDEDEPDDQDDNEDDDDPDDEDTEKSFADMMAEDSEEIEKAIEVSDFLSEIVNQIGEKLDGFNSRIEEMEKSFSEMKNQNGIIAETMKKSFSYFDGSMKKSFSDSKDLIKSQLEAWGSQPARKMKSKTVVLEKSGFEPDSEDETKMTKSQILKKMTDMIQKNVEGITATDIIKFESTGNMNPNVMDAIKAYR